MTRISDHGELDHIDQATDSLHYQMTQSERDLAAHMQAQLRFRLVAENARQKSRAMREQADRDYLKHNPTLDGQS